MMRILIVVILALLLCGGAILTVAPFMDGFSEAIKNSKHDAINVTSPRKDAGDVQDVALQNTHISRDCDSWSNSDFQGAVEQIFTDDKYGNFSFFKYSDASSNMTLAFDQSTTDLLKFFRSNPDEKVTVDWMRMLKNVIVELSNGVITIKPIKDKLEERSVKQSAVGLIALWGANKSSTIHLNGMNRESVGVSLIHIDASRSPAALLNCSHQEGCWFFKNEMGKLVEQNDIKLMKESWNVSEIISAVENTCDYITINMEPPVLQRYEEINGACGVVFEDGFFQTLYDSSVNDCQVFMKNTMPVLKNFFGLD